MAYWASMRHIPHVWNHRACCLCCPDIAAGIFPDGGMWYKIRFCLIRKRQSLRWRSAKHDIWDEQHLPEHIRRFARTAHFKGNGQKLTPMNRSTHIWMIWDRIWSRQQAEGIRVNQLQRKLWEMRPMKIRKPSERWREETIGSRHVSCFG